MIALTTLLPLTTGCAVQAYQRALAGHSPVTADLRQETVQALEAFLAHVRRHGP